jgi:polar amino acid transport system substrate-binding protein
MLIRRRFLTLLAAASIAGMMSLGAQAAGTLKVGAYPNNPPFEFKTADGSFEGFEIDITKELAKRLGMNTDIKDYGFQALFAGIASRRIDVALSSITITPDRLKTMGFTQPYFTSDQGIATLDGSPINSTADLKGKNVGVLSGSSGEKWTTENSARLGFADVKGYNSQENMFQDLRNRRIDAAVSDVPGMQYLFAKEKGFAVKARIEGGEQYGLMLAKDNPLFGKINDALSSMKTDGTMAQLYKKWFGVEPAQGSSTISVLPVPKG